MINLDKLQKLYDSKKITNNTIINISELKKINLLRKNDTKIKVLGNGDLKFKLKLEVDFISKAAKKKIEKVVYLYKNLLKYNTIFSILVVLFLILFIKEPFLIWTKGVVEWEFKFFMLFLIASFFFF